MINQNPRIERGITKLIIPHEKGELVTIYPAKGPGAYRTVGKEILDAGEKLQTGYETTLMLNSAYNSKEKEFQDVKEIMKNNYFHIFQIAFWLSEQDKNSGVYSVYDKEALGREMEFNQEELESKLKGAEVYQGVRFNPEEGIAFAPRNTINFGKQNWDTFGRNGLLIANHLPKGAENLTNLGKENFKSGWVYGVTGNNQVEKRMSALGGDWDYGRRLFVVGDFDGFGSGFAFGVSVAD